MTKSERVRELLPLIGQIKDQKLRNGVVKVWVTAWEESKWVDPSDCPFNVKVHDCDLMQHTNFVINVALSMASAARDIWHIPVDADLVLAAAALHDVSKLVEYEPSKGKSCQRSALGENLVHGAYGVHLALKAGLSLKLAHLIGCHTPQVAQMPRVVEGVFLYYADSAAADSILMSQGLPLFLKK